MNLEILIYLKKDFTDYKSENIQKSKKRVSFISDELHYNNANFIEEKLVASNPMLESFGNCKTLINDNSSRFGKYLSIFVDLQSYEIKGCFIKQYLLEKSRVSSPNMKERNFHIFYQVICGLRFIFTGVLNNNLSEIDLANQIFEKLTFQDYYCGIKNLENRYLNLFKILPEIKLLKTITELFSEEEFNLLKKIPKIFDVTSYNILKTECYDIPNNNDAKNFLETLGCFLKTGFEKENIKSIIILIIFILLLGNTEFDLDHESNSNVNRNLCKVTNDSKIYLEIACNLMKFDEKKFSEENFLFNILKIKNEVIKSNNPLVECYFCKNSFIKEIYNKIFLFIVGQLNSIFFKDDIKEQYKLKNENIKTLNILDIFGYENLEVNNFEQFSINYANEKMHQLYIKNNLKIIEERFKEEELIEYFDNIKFYDNIEILELIEKPQNGLLKILETESNLTKKDDNFVKVILFIIKFLFSSKKF